MNRCLAILVLAVFLFPLWGQLSLFHLRKWQIRYGLKERLEQQIPLSSLELIKIPASWLDKAPDHFRQLDRKEFRLRGRMYDIVHQETRADTLWNYCLADEAETRLFADLDEWVQQQCTHDPFQEGQARQWQRLLDNLFACDISAYSDRAVESLTHAWPAHVPAYQSAVLDTDTPPPRT